MSMVNLVVLVLFPLTQVGGYSLLLVLPVSTTVGCACGVQYCYPPLVLVSSTAIHCWSPLLLGCGGDVVSDQILVEVKFGRSC